VLRTIIWCCFAITLITILAGGIVRTTQSGMGCPDFPTCFGMWVPPTNAAELPADYEKYLRKQDIDHTFNAYHTWIEYINRLVGVLCGIFGILQLIVAFRKRKTFPRIFKNAKFFLIGVIITGLFGAIVVFLNLAHLSVSVHLSLSFVLALIQVHILMLYYNKHQIVAAPKIVQQMALVLFIATVIQIFLGTEVRKFIDDISKSLNYQQREKWVENLPIFFYIHRTFSWLVAGLTILFIYYFKKHNILKLPILLLLFIVLCSVLTGATMVYFAIPDFVQPTHVILSIALLCTSYYMLKTLRR
jgi:heme a synthase